LVATPILTGVVMSFFAHGNGSWHLVGLANYQAILVAEGLGATHPLSFWFTLFVTVAWTVLNVVAHVGIGVGLALILNQPNLRFGTPFRIVLILPWAIPNYVTALAWRGLFDEQIGAINAMISLFGGSGVAWWDQSLTAFAANLTTNMWLGFPFMMVTALGALASLPNDQIEAARLDGASAWMRLRHIILPQLLPAMIPAMLLGTIWTFNAFNVIYLVSGGDPAHSTDILVSEAYRWAFEGQGRYGYAAAYSVLIFGLLVVFGLMSSGRKARR
jgi:arabinogalactan oligomer/maltooligosaccharide transport system permease protein